MLMEQTELRIGQKQIQLDLVRPGGWLLQRVAWHNLLEGRCCACASALWQELLRCHMKCCLQLVASNCSSIAASQLLFLHMLLPCSTTATRRRGRPSPACCRAARWRCSGLRPARASAPPTYCREAEGAHRRWVLMVAWRALAASQSPGCSSLCSGQLERHHCCSAALVLCP